MRNLVAILLIFSTGQALATTYRWVDTQGKVHYSDVMPAQQSGLGHQELDKQGRVVRETPRIRPEESQRRVSAAALLEQQQRQAQAQQRHDRALLSTYADESEIALARDRALELERLTLKELRANLDSCSTKLARANGQLAGYRAAHAAEPANLLQMRDEAQAELAQTGEALRQRGKAIDSLKQRFEADRARYRELVRLNEAAHP